MWIEKRKTGYKFCERYVDRYTGKQKRVSVTLKGKTLPYQIKATELLREKMMEQKESIGPRTLNDLAALYLEGQEGVVKKQTISSVRTHLKPIIRTLDGDVLIDKIDATYVNTKFRIANLTPTAYNGQLKYFKALIRWGYRNDYIKDVSFLDKIVRAKDPVKKAKLQDKYMEPEELALFINSLTSKHWELLSRFLVTSGLRVGEAIALDRSDIGDEYISVNKTFSLILHEISSVKTEMSDRLVYIQDELRDVIQEINAYYDQAMEGFCYTTDHFFSNEHGGYISYMAYAKYFRENSQRILGRTLTPHCLRHTHTSLLAASGLSLEQISRRLGHADSAITKDVYFHVTKKLREKDNEAIKNIKLL